MGTNYYLRNGEEELHIGKKSYGWEFSFQAYPRLGIFSVTDWKNAFDNVEAQIVNEYNEVFSVEEMCEIIDSACPGSNFSDERLNLNHCDEAEGYQCYKDPYGYSFSLGDFS